MAYGVIEYNANGKPMCEICGKYYDRVIPHARQKHNISEKEYKIQFGFDRIKGICSKQSAEKSRLKVFENYDKVIKINLTQKGEKSRFSKGSIGRPKEVMSEQTRLKLVERIKLIVKK
jgi:hypothetical protein